MRKLISANILLFVSVYLAQAQTLDDIVSKHLEAMGGAARLRAVQTMSMERVDAGDPQKGNSITTYRKRSDKFRIETIDITPETKMRIVQGCDGKTSWHVFAHALAGRQRLHSWMIHRPSGQQTNPARVLLTSMAPF